MLCSCAREGVACLGLSLVRSNTEESVCFACVPSACATLDIGVRHWEGLEVCDTGRVWRRATLGGSGGVRHWEGLEACDTGRVWRRATLGGSGGVRHWEGLEACDTGRVWRRATLGGSGGNHSEVLFKALTLLVNI